MLCWYHSCFLCKKLALNIHTYRKHTFEEFWDVLTSKQSMYFFKTSTSKIINDMFLLLDFSYQNYHTFLQFCIYYTVLYRHTQDNPIYWQKQSFNITNFPVKFLTQQTTPVANGPPAANRTLYRSFLNWFFWILRISVIYFDFETTGMNHKLNFFKSSKKIINGIFILLDFLYKNDVVFHTSTMFYAF